MSFGAFWLGLRLFAGRAFKWGLKALSAVVEFVFDDLWRAIALVAIGLFAWSTFVIVPAWRETAAGWHTLAGVNLNAFYEEQAAHAQSIENIRAASAAAQAEAEANAARIEAEQRAINERNARDFQNRLGSLRARYDQLVRLRATGGEPAPQRPGAGGADPADLPGVPAFPARADEAAGDPRLPQPGAATCPAGVICLTLEQAWIASVQAIQLDALITTIEQRQQVPAQ
jgi:hypothetical protein